MPWDGRLGKLRAAPEVLVVRADPAAGGLLSQDEAHNAQQFHGNVDGAMVPGLSHALHVEDPAGLAAVFNPFIECLTEL